MERLRSRSVPCRCTITNGNALIQPVYVKVSHCQCPQAFLSLFQSDEKSSGNGKKVYMRIVTSIWNAIYEFLLSAGLGD